MSNVAEPPVRLEGYQSTGIGVTAMTTDANAGRRDGREADALRAMSATQGGASRPDGSARVRAGLTDVVASVYGPLDAPVQKQRFDAADMFVSLRGTPSTSEDVVSRAIKRAVAESVLCRLHPRRAIAVGVHVVCDDGGVIATAVNAAFLALVDAGVEMRSMLTAACVAVKDGAMVVDPERVEEVEADAVLTFTFDPTPRGEDELVAVFSHGDCASQEVFMRAAETARNACASTRAFFKLSVVGKIGAPE